MATQYGHAISFVLVSKLGWKWDESDDEHYGDRHVIDPRTGKSHTPYEAIQIEASRE